MIQTCLICGYKGCFHLFRKRGKWYPIDHWQCPKCKSHKRHRLIWKVYQKLRDQIKLNIVLHISPMQCLRDKFERKDNMYISIDFPPRQSASGVSMAHLKQDLEHTCFKDGYFTFVICSHVLDQIREEANAIEELYRIMQDDGILFICAPIYQKKTEELEVSVHDHWRRPGLDYFNRFNRFKKIKIYQDNGVYLGVFKK